MVAALSCFLWRYKVNQSSVRPFHMALTSTCSSLICILPCEFTSVRYPAAPAQAQNNSGHKPLDGVASGGSVPYWVCSPSPCLPPSPLAAASCLLLLTLLFESLIPWVGTRLCVLRDVNYAMAWFGGVYSSSFASLFSYLGYLFPCAGEEQRTSSHVWRWGKHADCKRVCIPFLGFAAVLLSLQLYSRVHPCSVAQVQRPQRPAEQAASQGGRRACWCCVLALH